MLERELQRIQDMAATVRASNRNLQQQNTHADLAWCAPQATLVASTKKLMPSCSLQKGATLTIRACLTTRIAITTKNPKIIVQLLSASTVIIRAYLTTRIAITIRNLKTIVQLLSASTATITRNRASLKWRYDFYAIS